MKKHTDIPGMEKIHERMSTGTGYGTKRAAPMPKKKTGKK